MVKRFLLLIILMAYVAGASNARLLGVHRVSSLAEAQAQIDEHVKHPSETLLAVDIDLTLTAPNHPALDLLNYKTHKAIFDEIFQNQNPLFMEKVFTHALMISGQYLIDPTSPAFLKNNRKQGLKVIAFTASIVGPLSPIASVEKMRYEILRSYGLDFSEAFVGRFLPLKSIALYNHQCPLYYYGILFANGGRAPHSKGDVMCAFLQSMKYRPKLLIIIDDRLKNIEEIASSLEVYDPDIAVLGLEFTAMHDHSTQVLSEQEFRKFWETMKELSSQVAD